jgi:fatty acid desaturase
MKRPASEGRSRRRRGVGRILSGIGVAVAAAGVWMIGAYVARAVSVLGSSDRSWLFWGLAILFAGLLFAGIGVTLFLLGRRITRSAAPGPPT